MPERSGPTVIVEADGNIAITFPEVTPVNGTPEHAVNNGVTHVNGQNGTGFTLESVVDKIRSNGAPKAIEKANPQAGQ